MVPTAAAESCCRRQVARPLRSEHGNRGESRPPQLPQTVSRQAAQRNHISPAIVYNIRIASAI